MGDTSRRTVLLALMASGVLVAVVAGGVAGFVVLADFLDPFGRRPFDAAAWAAARPEQRALMAKDAIRHLPVGTPSAAVRERLGEPKLGDASGVQPREAVTWVYYLGSWSMQGLDAAFLDVHFGPDDRVVAVEIRGG